MERCILGFSASLFIALILNTLECYLNHWTLLLSFLLNNDINFKPIKCCIGLICLIAAYKMQQKQNILRIRRHNKNIFILPVCYLTESTVGSQYIQRWKLCCKVLCLWGGCIHHFPTSEWLRNFYSYSVP